MENLRLFLYPYDPESSVYFGCRFKAYFSQGYMSGGGGYVLSRDALRRLNLFALNSTTICKLNGESGGRSDRSLPARCGCYSWGHPGLPGSPPLPARESFHGIPHHPK